MVVLGCSVKITRILYRIRWIELCLSIKLEDIIYYINEKRKMYMVIVLFIEMDIQYFMMLLLCLPTPLTLVCGGSPIIPLLVHQPAYLSIWPAASSL